MKRLCIVFLFFALVPVTFASKKEKKDEPSLRRVGMTYRQFTAPDSYDWRGSDDHTISAVIWYPAEAGADEKDEYIGEPPLFFAGRAAKEATLAPSFGAFPLVALSHGTGGSALQMAWLGTYLASRGYIAVSVNHPGNNAITGYTPQGFIEWWWRARDMSVAIDGMLADHRFGSKVDRDHIAAAGFSLGGYTVMELAGGRTAFQEVLTWCELPEHVSACNPPEMPGLVDKFEAMKAQPEVQEAISHAGDSFRDPRIRAVFAIAPAIARAFSTDSLREISIPVDIVAGDRDTVVPPDDNARRFAVNIPGAQLTVLPGGVGHYTFLDVGTDLGKKRMPQFFVDNPGVDREAVHKQVAAMVADFFDQQFASAKKNKKK